MRAGQAERWIDWWLLGSWAQVANGLRGSPRNGWKGDCGKPLSGGREKGEGFRDLSILREADNFFRSRFLGLICEFLLVMSRK